jgi:hypothetical protein
MQTSASARPTFSIPSILALLAAIGSFMNGAILGLILALCAIVLGIIGVVISLAPAKRGGVISTLGIGAGALGIVAALVKAVMWIFS